LLHAVLGLSAVLEGYSLYVATRYVMAGAASHQMTMVKVRAGVGACRPA